MAAIRVVLADDHEVVRTALRMVLNAEEGIEVTAEAGDVDEMLQAVDDHRPDVLILDLTMPGTLTPLEALPEVRTRCAMTATVVLTMHDNPAYARLAFRNGALGYVLKDANDVDFVAAVRQAASGQIYRNDSLETTLVTLPERPPSADGLTEREGAVLQLIALGHTNVEIAEQLFLSVRTVETHRANLQHKLGRSTRAELVRYAVDNGMLDPD